LGLLKKLFVGDILMTNIVVKGERDLYFHGGEERIKRLPIRQPTPAQRSIKIA